MKRATEPETALTLYAGIYCKTYRVPDAFSLMPQHAHEHDHLTLLMSGAIRVWYGDTDVGFDYYAPHTLKIAAHTKHRFLTLTGNVTLACIHSVGEADGPAIYEAHEFELED
jgi:hypothetical protein